MSRAVLQVVPEWAPLGAARFRELVEERFYDDNRIFRVLDGTCSCDQLSLLTAPVVANVSLSGLPQASLKIRVSQVR